MLPYFPKYIANKAVVTYVIALAAVTLLFSSMAMELKFFAFGCLEVFGFFYASSSLTKGWARMSPGAFASKLFRTAFAIRLVWVVFSYFFYINETGQPFEWAAADSMGYHGEAEWLSGAPWDVAWNYWDIGRRGVSDVGYVLYLTALYKIVGPSVFIARVLKALFGAWTCVLVYRLSSRTFGFEVGRMAAVFCLLMPNLIYYCGIHTKETEMVFCVLMFLERADYIIRARSFKFKDIAIASFFALSLFFFRTVLGVVAFFSFFTALLFSSGKVLGARRRSVLIGWGVAAVLMLAGGTIMNEVENYWNLRVTNEVVKRDAQAAGGARWAKYATGTVMAPMVFTLPFSTMVDTGQYTQNLIHGGAFVKNFMSLFVFLALFYAITDKKWRDFSLIGAFTIGYLGIISFSGYANAERFHMPTLPLVLMMAAYGVSRLSVKNIKLLNYWPYIVLLMELGWTYFKLGSRGLL